MPTSTRACAAVCVAARVERKTSAAAVQRLMRVAEFPGKGPLHAPVDAIVSRAAMAAEIIDGRAVAARVRARVAEEVPAFVSEHGHPPGLATVLVGDDPASAVYVGGKQKATKEVGMAGFDHRLPDDVSPQEVVALIEHLNADARVSGIILQLPVPDHLDGVELTGLVDPGKDVDGLTPVSAGLLALGRPGLRPATPTGVMDLLAEVDTELTGAEA